MQFARLSRVVLLLGLSLFSVALITSSGERGQALPIALAQTIDCGLGQGNVSFFGSDFQSDTFVWCIDQSCSMGWNGRLDQVKQEVTVALNQLNASQSFALVAFNSTVSSFAAAPMPASPAQIALATQWIQSLQASDLSCAQSGGVEALTLAGASTSSQRAVLFVSDGGPNCPDPSTALTEITNANFQQIPIHAIQIGTDAAGINFMQQLAALNGGSFTLVP